MIITQRPSVPSGFGKLPWSHCAPIWVSVAVSRQSATNDSGLPVQFGIASIDDSDSAKAWLSDSNNGGDVDLTGSDQVRTCSSLIEPRTRQTRQIDVTPALRLGAPGPFLQHPPRDLKPPCPTHLACDCVQGTFGPSAINAYWPDTTAMDDLRAAAAGVAGTEETISDNVAHTDSNNAETTITDNADVP